MAKTSRFVRLGLIFLVLTSCSHSPKTAIDQARAFHQDAQWGETINACNAHLAIHADDTEALLMRGQSHLALQRFEEALGDFSRVIELSQDDSEAYYFRSRVYREMGDEELAFNDRERALARDPSHGAAYKYAPANFAAKVKLDPPSRSSSEATEEGEASLQPDSAEPEPFEPREIFAEDSRSSSRLSASPAGAGGGPTGGHAVASGPAPSGGGVPNGPIFGSPNAPADAMPGFGGPQTQVIPEKATNRAGPAGGPVPEERAAAEQFPSERYEGIPGPMRYERSNPAISSALPTSPIDGGGPPAGIQPRWSNRSPKMPLMPQTNQNFGLPHSGLSAPKPTTGIQSRARSSTVPRAKPTGTNQLSTGLASPHGTAIPTQLAPNSPYRLQGNPIPGKASTSLSTSLRPNQTAPVSGIRRPSARQQTPSAPKTSLSTALPADQGAGS